MGRSALLWMVASGVLLSASLARAEPEGGQPLDELKRHYAVGGTLATQISEATGVAMTPLLGMTALAARAYFTTPKAERPSLPWYQSPPFFITGAALLLLLFFGHRIPMVRGWFKTLKLYESKLSALLAIPLVATSVAGLIARPVGSAVAAAAAFALPTAHAAGAATSPVVTHAGSVVAWIAAAVATAVVWLAAHTINVLVLVSPFAVIDWALKTFRAGLIGLLILGLVISPWLGLAISVVYIGIALLIAGWSFRLMVFGTVFSMDLFTFRWTREQVNPERIGAFAAGLEDVPDRTWGSVRKSEGRIEFVYRPWFVLPRRIVALPASSSLVVERGLVSPSLLYRRDVKAMSILWLPPRFRTHDVALAEALGSLPVRDAPLVRGFKAMKAWLFEELDTHGSPATLDG